MSSREGVAKTDNDDSKVLNEYFLCGMMIRSFAVGQQYHNTEDKAPRILKVDWHPLSESDVHLGVLTDDGLLR